MRKQTTATFTENGAVTHSTTLDAVLDLFAMGGALRTRKSKEVESMFVKAFSEDATLALKCLFYLRDIRGGQGERNTFRIIMKYMANNHPDQIMHLLHLIPTYGRFDDLYIFAGTPLEKNALDHLKNATTEGHVAFQQIAFKWLKSENANSKESKKLAKLTREHLGMDSKTYRKFLTKGRAKVVGLVEIPMSKREFNSIDYSKVPSQAGLIYRTAFHVRDGERYKKFIEEVSKKPELRAVGMTIKTATLYPSDIIGKVISGKYDKTMEAMWMNLPNYVQKEQNALVMADTSGSMGTGATDPISVSVALAMYFAERNKGYFKDHFMVFDSYPDIKKIQGINLTEKVHSVLGSRPCGNTDLQASFDLLLKTAIMNRVPQSDMPSIIYVISDMEFDSGVRGFTNHSVIMAKYRAAGYVAPQIVYWNVQSRQDNVPVTYDARGVSLVSGYSPVLFRQVMENKGPVELMTEVLNAERYKPIVSVK